MKRLLIFADGASLGNPGPAAIGAIIKDEQGKLIASISQSIGRATNNQAEYKALIAALEKAIGLGAHEVDIKLDSELLVRQISGQYRVKAQGLKPLHRQLKILLSQLRRFTVTHIPGEQNGEAHNLAHMALK